MPDDTTISATTEMPATDARGAEAADDDGEEPSAEGLKRALEAERQQRKQFERQLREAQRKAAAADSATLSEQERLTKRLAELEAKEREWETERRETRLKERTVAALEGARAKSPARVYRLLRPDLELDDDGEPRNLAAVLRTTKQEFPELFYATNGSADGGAGTGGVEQDMNVMIRRAAGRG